MTYDEANGENEPSHAVSCPLCNGPKPEHVRACRDCRSVLQAVAITESQALRDARIIKNWRAQ